MKKTLLTFCALGLGLLANAQVLLTENASDLTIGNVGDNLTGTSPGQGDWLTSVAAGGSNSDFQVVDQGGDLGNLIQITGSNTALNSRRMFKDISGAWGFRDTGNDVAEVQVRLFSGPPTTSNNSLRVVLYNADVTKMIGGIMLSLSSKVLSGLSYYDNTASAGGVLGNYSFRLSYTTTPAPAYSDLVLQPNTWYTVGFSVNRTTGEVVFKESTGLITSPPIIGASAGLDPIQLNMVVTAISAPNQANAVSGIGLFDNLHFQASATSGPLLAVRSNEVAEQSSIYPNPADNIINISNGSTPITSVSVTDLNGRIVKKFELEKVNDAALNVSDLSSGIYLVKIKSAEGESVKKIIKN